MATTGALYRQPDANPDGSSAGSHLVTGPAPRVNEGGSVSTPAGEATSPPISVMPASGSAASSRNLLNVRAAQLPTRSSVPTRWAPQSAPAVAEVVRCGGSAAPTPPPSPAPSTTTPPPRPQTPAPSTRAAAA